MAENRPNNARGEDAAQFAQLVFRYLDGVTTSEEDRAIDERLRSSEDDRQTFVEICRQASLLTEVVAPPRVSQEATAAIAPVGERPAVLGTLGDVFRAGADFVFRPPILTLLLAIGLPGMVLLMLMLDIARQPVPTAPLPVATVARTHECVWDKGGLPVSRGMGLFSGEQLRLQSGLVELAFADGATALVQGPAEFCVISKKGGLLSRGALTARVPEAARGFTIRTPLAKVVDLGTEFGVSVAEDGVEETHVFDGQVEVTARDAAGGQAPAGQLLEAGEAVQVVLGESQSTPQLVTMTARPRRFVHQLPDNLPEPTILFAHHGDANPTKEGWKLRGPDGVRKGSYKVGPIAEGGVPAWFCRSSKDGKAVFYEVAEHNGLTPALVAEAKRKGWMLRFRVWVDPEMPSPENPRNSLALCSYRDDVFTWGMHVVLDEKGNQLLKLPGQSSLGKDAAYAVPGSRGRYVDYELRYDPAAKCASILIDGRRVADRIQKPRIGEYATLRFGMYRVVPSNSRWASVEWGIYRDTTENENDPNRSQR